jgi:hypothetical protein
MPIGGELWSWVDFDGSQYKLTEETLHGFLTKGTLPPFVLIWRRGYSEWMPAYLIPEFRSALGSEELVLTSGLELDPNRDQPPDPPLEWYIECLGADTQVKSLEQARDSKPSMLDLDWQEFASEEQFSEFEAPTRKVELSSLPAAAFPDAETYLSHIRNYRSRSR